jgi:hypothetical protein
LETTTNTPTRHEISTSIQCVEALLAAGHRAEKVEGFTPLHDAAQRLAIFGGSFGEPLELQGKPGNFKEKLWRFRQQFWG